MKKKVLIFAYRAYGDWVYTLPALNVLFDNPELELYIDLNWKGFQLFQNDPRFHQISLFQFEQCKPEELAEDTKNHYQALIDQVKPDIIYNFNNSLEKYCIVDRSQPLFHEPLGARRMQLGDKNFYDAVFNVSGIPRPSKLKLDGLHFTPEELEIGEVWRKEHAEQFILIVPIAGSGSHKIFYEGPEFIEWVVNSHPDVVVYVTGNKEDFDEIKVKSDRVFNACSNINIKQAMFMTKYADMVIGAENGVTVAAGMWGTPKIMLCTASSVYQCTGYTDNDFSIQAMSHCSPCHRSIYVGEDCQNHHKQPDGSSIHPECIFRFNLDDIKERFEHVYNAYQSQKSTVRLREGLLSEV